MLRLAIVTDIHHGRDTFTKRGTAALPLLRRFVEETNADPPDAVIEIGDRISDVDHARDQALAADVADLLKGLGAPRHHVCGNHDIAHLSVAENEAVLDAPLASRSVAVGDVRLVFWQPDVRLTRERGFHLAEGDLDVLERLLGEDDRRTLLVSHVPLSGASMRGNYWFENNPAHAAYAQMDVIRHVLATAPCTLVALSGHVHWNSLTTVDGVSHLTQQSLTESFTTRPAVAEATGRITIDAETLSWRVSGNDPVAIMLPFPASRRLWTAPLPRFADMDSDPTEAAAPPQRPAHAVEPDLALQEDAP